ncbi:MAG TPA: sigma-70 family RNA polymerase sigma factor [Chitinophagales bacterium]|jgi:RNA polymerase sigma-70 factor (ECF subfamily)|nr:sigma-70 family RNA polymerase sigma factor [Chitinophagales bacterium]
MQSRTLSDDKLVELYLAGEESALGELLNRHKDRIYTYIYLFCRDTHTAEDLLQETFIKVIDKLRSGKYQEQNKFLPWISRVAYNLCIDYYRREKRMPKVVTRDGFDIFSVLKFSEPGAEGKVMDHEFSSRVRKLLEYLPEEQREVVVLRHYMDLNFREIAEMTGVNINTALGRMRYALINLRKLMETKNITI